MTYEETVEVITLAKRFSEIVGEWLTAREMREVIERNGAYDWTDGNRPCHSHDFCDANMAMEQAFKDVTGRDPMPSEAGMSDADLDLWNAAWLVASTSDFYI